MLKGLDPILGPDLLAILRAMGHGDELAVVDANFPAAASARRLVRLDGIAAPRVVTAVLSVLSLDDFVDSPATRMAVVDDPAAVPEICREFAALVDQATTLECGEPVREPHSTTRGLAGLPMEIA